MYFHVKFATSASLPSMRLNARSRQFSRCLAIVVPELTRSMPSPSQPSTPHSHPVSYILMLGTLAPGGELEPKYAITIKVCV